MYCVKNTVKFQVLLQQSCLVDVVAFTPEKQSKVFKGVGSCR